MTALTFSQQTDIIMFCEKACGKCKMALQKRLFAVKTFSQSVVQRLRESGSLGQ